MRSDVFKLSALGIVAPNGYKVGLVKLRAILLLLVGTKDNALVHAIQGLPAVLMDKVTRC